VILLIGLIDLNDPSIVCTYEKELKLQINRPNWAMMRISSP
jgi:hypothetical protein